MKSVPRSREKAHPPADDGKLEGGNEQEMSPEQVITKLPASTSQLRRVSERCGDWHTSPKPMVLTLQLQDRAPGDKFCCPSDRAALRFARKGRIANYPVTDSVPNSYQR
jgi:hypothetical protein